MKREYGTRILLGCFGPQPSGAAGHGGARSPALRTKSAADLADVLAADGFDGADFDWEYPASQDLDAFGGFLGDVRAAFAPRGLEALGGRHSPKDRSQRRLTMP